MRIAMLCILCVTGPSWGLEFGGQELKARARANACYLIFVDLYRATYYASSRGDTGCVELEYRRSFSREELAQATSRVYKDLYGDLQHAADAENLQLLVQSYRSVVPGDRYRFCASPVYGGELLRGDEPVRRIDDRGFARRLLGIWVADGGGGDSVEWNFPACARQEF
jgi:hypothetical protein